MTFTTGQTPTPATSGPPTGAALSTAHADAAGVAAGDRALDVGCGPGVLLAELSRRLGADYVAGVDPSPPFVDAARRSVAGADVRLAAAEKLPFDSRAFDVVLSQLVVNFMDDTDDEGRTMRYCTETELAALWRRADCTPGFAWLTSRASSASSRARLTTTRGR